MQERLLTPIAESRCGACGGCGVVPDLRCTCPDPKVHTCAPRTCPACAGSGRACAGEDQPPKVTVNGPLAGELQTLAEWLDEQLGGEEYSRQSIAETAASRVRELSAIAATAASYSRDRGRLTDAQRELLTRMASDACAYRRPGLFCNDCDDAPSGLCPDHEEDLDLTDAYIRLVRDLGGEVTT